MSESPNHNFDNKPDNNQPIFKFLLPNENNQLTNLTPQEIKHLVNLIQKHYLTYRQKLNFDQNITFGVEIELQKRFFHRKTKNNHIYTEIREITGQKNWEVEFDGSLLKYGCEAISPILNDTNNTWINLENTCSYLNKIGYINELCGGHIHVGTHIIGSNFQAWDNFIKLWIVYENIILRFVSGEYQQLRNSLYTWAPPIAQSMLDSYYLCQKFYSQQITEPFLKYFCYLLGSTRQAINFKNITNLEKKKTKNTIEFRCPNGTLNPIIWQNNINLFLTILTSVQKNEFNQELLNHKFQGLNPQNIYIPNNYQTINLPSVLEFCDLIFNNNLDKIYFLKQYLKDQKKNPKHYKKIKHLTKYK